MFECSIEVFLVVLMKAVLEVSVAVPVLVITMSNRDKLVLFRSSSFWSSHTTFH